MGLLEVDVQVGSQKLLRRYYLALDSDIGNVTLTRPLTCASIVFGTFHPAFVTDLFLVRLIMDQSSGQKGTQATQPTLVQL